MVYLESSSPKILAGRYLLLRPHSREGTTSGPLRSFLTFDLEARAEAILTTMVGEEPERRRFLAECDVVRQLTAPSVVKALGSGEIGESVYLCEDLPATVSLRSVLGEGPLPRELAYQVFWQLCTALVAFHGRGVVHGGVDPENILFTPGGDLVLGGFLPAPARILMVRMTASEVRARSTPPEWIDSSTILPTGDLYSLGLVLAELLTGLPVFPPGTLQEVRERQRLLARELGKDCALLATLPPPFRLLMQHFLQPDPERRPRGLMQVIPHLESALAGTRYRALPGEAMRQRVTPLFLAEQQRILEGTDSRLEAGETLIVSTGLSLASQMGSTPRSRSASLESAVSLLWRTFLPLPPRVGTALCDQVVAAAGLQGLEAVKLLARWRREQVEVSPDGPAPHPRISDAKMEQLAGAVRASPSNQLALLTLAVARPDRCDPSSTLLPLVKASLCEALGLPAAAVFHAAQALAEGGQEDCVMEYLEALFQHRLGGADLLDEAPPLVESMPALLVEGPVPASGERLGPDEVEQLLEASQASLEKGHLVETAELLERLFVGGGARAERSYSSLVARINDFLWKVILRRSEERLDEALGTVARIARSIGLHSIVPIVERLLVAAIPEAELPDRLEALLRDSGASIPILQAASRVAASRGRDEEWVGHLAAAGEKFLEVGELTLATKMFMALRAMRPESGVAQRGMERVLACGTLAVEAGEHFAEVERSLARSDNPARSLVAVQEFLERFPNHLPAQDLAAELLAGEGSTAEAASLLLGLAKRCMYREEDTQAREYLRRVLRTDYECDEALLYLVTLEPPDESAPTEIAAFKSWVFVREGLLEAAIYHTRKKLTGGATDLPILHEILEITQEAGKDPGSVLLEAGRIAWEGGQIPLARKYFDSAYRATQDKGALLDKLMRWEGIDEIFPMVDLLRVSTDPGKVLSLTEPGVLDPL